MEVLGGVLDWLLIISLGLRAEALRGLVCPVDAATQQRSIRVSRVSLLDHKLSGGGLEANLIPRVSTEARTESNPGNPPGFGLCQVAVSLMLHLPLHLTGTRALAPGLVR
jgi:hypothetical protein